MARYALPNFETFPKKNTFRVWDLELPTFFPKVCFTKRMKNEEWPQSGMEGIRGCEYLEKLGKH